MPGPADIQAILILQLWQKLKEDKPAALNRHLNVVGDLDSTNFDQFN